jgi:hypothetical protein
MTRLCLAHNAMCSEDGVWLYKLDDVTEIARRTRITVTLTECPRCINDKRKAQEFLKTLPIRG